MNRHTYFSKLTGRNGTQLRASLLVVITAFIHSNLLLGLDAWHAFQEIIAAGRGTGFRGSAFAT